jgi:hypothetical protein
LNARRTGLPTCNLLRFEKQQRPKTPLLHFCNSLNNLAPLAPLRGAGLDHDRVRDRFLKNLGYRILRIPGYAVIREGDAVITSIRDFVRESREG